MGEANIVDRVMRAAGIRTQTELARRLTGPGRRVSQQNVWYWRRVNRIPSRFAESISELTDGDIEL